MSSPQQPRPRARMAEARRNRQRLLDSAAELFASAANVVTLEAIAAAAGVGIGTLYRHFPDREALVEAVALAQIDELHSAATDLLAQSAPADALRQWMSALAGWARTKHGMNDTLTKIMATGRLDGGAMRSELVTMVSAFLRRGTHDGSLRSDVSAVDVAALLAAALATQSANQDHTQLDRVLDLVVDGLLPPGTHR